MGVICISSLEVKHAANMHIDNKSKNVYRKNLYLCINIFFITTVDRDAEKVQRLACSVADPDPGAGTFLIQSQIFES